MVGWEGRTPPQWLAAEPVERRPAGFIVGRHSNIDGVVQVRRLTTALQESAPPGRPFLIAADEEGGQLSAFVGMVTPFPGNMALGAAGDEDLARKVGLATAGELRALGVNVVLAPVVDVATVPGNPSLGIRAFGDDPATVGRLGAAMVAGYREGGVAATAKHFPGKGEAAVDPHDVLPVLDLDAARLDAVEFVPFRAALAAGCDLLMVGHYAVPSLTGSRTVPLSASPALEPLVRDRLGFNGVIMSDALDMGAFTGSATTADLVTAGIDLLLCTRDRAHHLEAAGAVAADSPARHAFAAARVDGLRRRLADAADPGEDVVGCAAHRELAATVAARSTTLVRDGGRLPLDPAARILAVMPRPGDLTPADTSSLQPPLLAAALRRHAGLVTEIVVPLDPSGADVVAVERTAADHDVVVVGTIAADAHQGQAELVRRVVSTHDAVVTVALRTPFDLAAYPEAATHICTYSVLPPSLDALAAALFGDAGFPGRLPAAVPGLYPTGHRGGT